MGKHLVSLDVGKQFPFLHLTERRIDVIFSLYVAGQLRASMVTNRSQKETGFYKVWAWPADTIHFVAQPLLSYLLWWLIIIEHCCCCCCRIPYWQNSCSGCNRRSFTWSRFVFHN